MGCSSVKMLWDKFVCSVTDVKVDTTQIPQGSYCYEILEVNPDSSYTVRKCSYFRSYKQGNTGCMAIGFFGFDVAHTDSCKICGIKQTWKEDLDTTVESSDTI